MNKAKKTFREVIFSKTVIVGVLLLIQLAMLLVFTVRFYRYFAAMYGVLLIVSLIVLLQIINDDAMNPSYKIAWIIPIIAFPMFGVLFYLMAGHCHLSKKTSARLIVEEKKYGLAGYRCDKAQAALLKLPAAARSQSEYIARAGYPAFTDTDVEYLSPGEVFFESLLNDLKSAERYIFMEYFIIGEGVMWQPILDVLEQKAKEGVDVRVIYDGFGCLNTLPNDYFKQLREKGIKCIEFNPLIPILTIYMNNRDHRKITVVDGKVGYMGGVNLADEYINVIDRFGHWKDSAVRLKGDAVKSLTSMFVTMYNALSPKDCCGMEKLEPDEPSQSCGGVVQPYSDTPLDKEQVGEGIYLNMIAKANRYIYMCTPYFIVDNELLTALLLAAKSGVDVRIITPHIGDKWYVHTVTRSFYPQLIAGGVKVYEYMPGFIHSKVFVSDDITATVGTVNLDYRSLYLHFECGVWMTGCSAIADIKQDFLTTLKSCHEITGSDLQQKGRGLRQLVAAIIRVFAPLM